MALRRINPSKKPLLHLPRPFSSFSNLSIPTSPPPPPSDDPDARFPPPNHAEPASQKPGQSSFDRFRESTRKIECQLKEKDSRFGGSTLSFQDLLRNSDLPMGWPNAHESLFKIIGFKMEQSRELPLLPSYHTELMSQIWRVMMNSRMNERELENEGSVHQNDDDLQKLDEGLTAEQKDQEDEQVNHRSGADGAKDKPKKSPKKPKRSPKKSSGDDLVGEMQRFVDVKENEASKEDAMDFSIARCIKLLRALEGDTPAMKARCYNVFKSAKNCEIFISAVAEEDGSALAWLRSQIGNSTCPPW